MVHFMGEIVRLQKYMAMCAVASRRKAEEMILQGLVKVNGKTVTQLGTKVEIGADKVSVGGKEIKAVQKKYYIMLNKPEGYVSTVHDQFDRPTVTELTESEINTRLFPVGRLDYDTSGLLLLTNDGDFSYRVTHPKFHIDKTYVASVKGGLTVSALKRLRSGVKIEDYTTSPAEVELLDSKDGFSRIKITIHEGKNRQVRKMFEAVGCKVVTLQRISIGTVSLGNLPLGRWRYLTSHEVSYFMGM